LIDFKKERRDYAFSHNALYGRSRILRSYALSITEKLLHPARRELKKQTGQKTFNEVFLHLTGRDIRDNAARREKKQKVRFQKSIRETHFNHWYRENAALLRTALRSFPRSLAVYVLVLLVLAFPDRLNFRLQRFRF